MANYTDLIKTNFPDSLDDRPDAVEEINRNSHFAVNINFEDRDALTSPTDYIVLADDVNALQESIIAVQRSLGVMPQGTDIDSTVGDRILNLEVYTRKGDSASQGYSDLDERYMWGGTRPTVNSSPAPLISIKGHSHDGTSGQADKIDLGTHVSGNLSKVNLDISSGTTSMLTAQDIKMSSASSETIPQALANKMDKDGGTFSGDMAVEGNFKSLSFFEVEAKDTGYSTGLGYVESGSDNRAYSGYSRQATMAATSGLLSFSSHKLRYGRYVAVFRVKSSSISGSTPLAKFSIQESIDTVSGSTIEELVVTPDDFDVSGEYKEFYLEFKHANTAGISARTYIHPRIDFYTGVADLSVDSIVITPITTAIYDDDII